MVCEFGNWTFIFEVSDFSQLGTCLLKTREIYICRCGDRPSFFAPEISERLLKLTAFPRLEIWKGFNLWHLIRGIFANRPELINCLYFEQVLVRNNFFDIIVELFILSVEVRVYEAESTLLELLDVSCVGSERERNQTFSSVIGVQKYFNEPFLKK